MYAKIVKITDKFGTDKLYDDEAMSRIGRIIDDVQSTISVGSRGIFYCVWPKFDNGMVTSKILSIVVDGDITILETKNSFYYLKVVEKLEQLNV